MSYQDEYYMANVEGKSPMAKIETPLSVLKAQAKVSRFERGYCPLCDSPQMLEDNSDYCPHHGDVFESHLANRDIVRKYKENEFWASQKDAEEEDAITKAVSGSHYNDVVPGFQYMQMMQYMLEGMEGVEAHLLGQTYKYLMRAGKKDDVEQEYRKARWYLNCLVKFKQTGVVDPNNND